jgi:hypothetical protein
MQDQIMVENHQQVVDSMLGQDQVMVELTATKSPEPRSQPTTTNSFIAQKNLQKEFFVGV